MSNLRKELDALAAKIAKSAASGSTSLQESVDALKVLTPYYALTEKLALKSAGDEDDGNTFEQFSAQITEPQEHKRNGRASVQGRRRDS